MISYMDAIQLLKKEGCSEKVIQHCIEVSRASEEIAERLQKRGYDVDIELVRIGGLLHDIGRGTTHGIMHADTGSRRAAELGLDEKLIAIIRNHIGAGIPADEAKEMGLPPQDYIPLSMEEKIVAHADNLVKGTKRISTEGRINRMKKKGVGKRAMERVHDLAKELGIRQL
ncbi:TIGR00295 family protein [Methanohalophilus mahii]|uniref:Metal dependent phosphohydrolase n=1 Tax=Methanohalophilus mahii (strain ATCC 35705 / DSM 5219 / SLP) TaxID=547558 RepID=D5EBY7_METMS|nr:TIGR00295 family protein [Methanohalophilus mahii]ADE36688.1 metal dependent phosphohydrolase [Methanohalophilus mahii DSM 5219]